MINYFLPTAYASESVPAKPVVNSGANTDGIQAAENAAETTEGTESAGGIGALGVHWNFLIPQLINFAIVMAILYVWVFKPIGKRLAERSEKIEKAVHDAEDIERQKAEFEAWKAESASDARKQAAEIIGQAQTEAAKLKEAVITQTKTEQQKLVDQAKARIEGEEKQSLAEVRSQAAELVVGATEKILRAKLDPKKDRELIDESLKGVQ